VQYALLIYTKPGSFEALSDEERETVSGQYWAVRDVPGVFDGAQLHPVDAATTVRVQDGQTLTTDGPFADTKEVLGGYYLIEADDLDRAIEIASKVPSTWMGGSVEIRPVVEKQR
jgi:hypothetical protein